MLPPLGADVERKGIKGDDPDPSSNLALLHFSLDGPSIDDAYPPPLEQRVYPSDDPNVPMSASAYGVLFGGGGGSQQSSGDFNPGLSSDLPPATMYLGGRPMGPPSSVASNESKVSSTAPDVMKVTAQLMDASRTGVDSFVRGLRLKAALNDDEKVYLSSTKGLVIQATHAALVNRYKYMEAYPGLSRILPLPSPDELYPQDSDPDASVIVKVWTAAATYMNSSEYGRLRFSNDETQYKVALQFCEDLATVRVLGRILNAYDALYISAVYGSLYGRSGLNLSTVVSQNVEPVRCGYFDSFCDKGTLPFAFVELKSGSKKMTVDSVVAFFALHFSRVIVPMA